MRAERPFILRSGRRSGSGSGAGSGSGEAAGSGDGAGETAGSEIVIVREEPPGGGPAAAIIAGLAHVDAEEVLLLAGDLVDGARAVETLIAARPVDTAGRDGTVLVDPTGRRQWLCARLRTQALRQAAAGLAEPAGARMSELFTGLRCRELVDLGGVSADIDTWQDLSRARSRMRGQDTTNATSGVQMSDRPLPPEALDEWSSVLQDRFGLDAAEVPIALVLDLARDVAHDVARPAAPLSAFVAGLVAGRAGGTPEAASDTIAEVVALARAWAQGRSDAGSNAPGDGGR